MSTAAAIPVRDTVLWVEDTAELDLPAVICLHSLWLDGTMFDELVVQARGRFRVIRPDFRGQGRSAPSGEAIIDMETCAEDIEALIDLLQIRSVSLLAQSMGGDVALRLAAHRPELFRCLVMLGTSARNEPPEQIEWVRGWLESAAVTGFTGDNLVILMAVMFGESTRSNPAKQEMLKYWSARMEASPFSLWPAIRGVIERKSAVPLLNQVTVPTLIFSGTEDMPRPPAWADEVAEGLPNAKLVRLEGVGHSPLLESPEVVLSQILAFLESPRVA